MPLWRIALALWTLAGARQLGLIAAGVAFFAMLALFPALAALIALVGFWVDPGTIRDFMALAGEFVPPEALAIVSGQVEAILSAGTRTLGWASALSLLATYWSARRGVGALVQGLSAIYGAPPRGGLRDLAVTLGLTAALIGVGAVAMLAMLITPLVLAVAAPFLPETSILPKLTEILRWGVSISVLVVGLGLFYRFGPDRDIRSPFFSPGLALALALWAGTSIAFSMFLSNFGNYNEIYGSIGAVIALLMWFYISAYSVLLGGALNYTLESSQVG
jgi:membrane protein